MAPRLTCARLRTLHLYNCLQLASLVLFCPALELLNLTHCVALSQLSLATPKLPPGWLEAKDEKNRTFYWSARTKETRWARPVAASAFA